MWYGQQAFANVSAQTLETFFASVDGGSRPEHMEGYHKPPFGWEKVMSQCLTRQPQQRPTAKECYEEMMKLSTKLKNPIAWTLRVC